MLFQLKPVIDHPTFEMQLILESTIKAARDNIDFSKNCFPLILQNDWKDDWQDNDCFIKKLHDNLYSFIKEHPEKEKLCEQFLNNNKIQTLCNEESIRLINDFDWDIKENNRNKEVYKFLLSCYESLDLVMFRLNKELIAPRKEFDNIFRNVNNYLCPFCGLHLYPNELGDGRSDFDHFLNKADYPFASSNMYNLFPMCDKCNQKAKKAKNPFIYEGTRTLAFYPYDVLPEISYKLTCTTEPLNNRKGEWKLDITPVINDASIRKKIDTWDRLFNIKKRTIDEIEVFHNYWVTKELDNKKEKFTSFDGVREFMDDRKNHYKLQLERKMEPCTFAKVIFFDYLSKNSTEKFIYRYFEYNNNKIQKTEILELTI